MMKRLKILGQHARNSDDRDVRIGMLPAFDFFQLFVALLSPKPNLSPLWNAHEIMLPKRFGRTCMWLNNVGRPSNSHVVDNIEVERPEFGSDQRSAIQARTRHFAELVRNNAIFGNRFVKSKCHHVDVMTATHKRTSKLPGPMLGATADGVELFQDERDFHGGLRSEVLNFRFYHAPSGISHLGIGWRLDAFNSS